MSLRYDYRCTPSASSRCVPKSELSHVPECRRVIQARTNFLHVGPFGAFFPPALFDNFPQFIIEPKAGRVIRLCGPDPFDNRVHDQRARGDVVEWVVPGQNLEDFMFQ